MIKTKKIKNDKGLNIVVSVDSGVRANDNLADHTIKYTDIYKVVTITVDGKSHTYTGLGEDCKKWSPAFRARLESKIIPKLLSDDYTALLAQQIKDIKRGAAVQAKYDMDKADMAKIMGGE